MLKIRRLLLYTLLVSLWSCGTSYQELETHFLSVGIDEMGHVVSLYDKSGHKEYIPEGISAPILSIRIKDSVINPVSMKVDADNQLIKLLFPVEEITAEVKYEAKETHLNFELVHIEHVDLIDLIIWGPYPTSIDKIIGETVGVVRGESYAIGLQSLNIKTLGGYPWKENDCMPQLDIFDGDDPSDLNEAGKRYVLYRVEAAKPDTFGSTLQAYCRNRNRLRIIENWGHEHYEIPAFDDGGVIGSKIALFGCPVEQALDVLGSIEVEEGLPHPMINGEWGKKSKEANAAYLILAFGEEDMEEAIRYTKKAGLKYLYHPGPFDSWGHFTFNKQFPNGQEGLKNCVEKAEKDGIYIGLHTLSNFITTNDAYVTPVPDKRLAKVGSSVITSAIGSDETEIPVKEATYFSQMTRNNLKTVVINDELITYNKVSEVAPFKLMECQRGAFGTRAASHGEGTTVSLLADHAYNVFLSNADLTKEIAINIASIFNSCGLRQISFDGLEGNRSTGLGNYGEILMADTWYNNLDPDIRSHFIADASRTSHYFWHIFTRMNWGEPWYAGFRESQTEYRFKNQAYFQRNMIPGMLGWFLLTDETSLEDIEWMLSKSAAWDAGYGFVCNYNTLENNGMTDQILAKIGLWEEVRMNQVLDQKIKAILKDPEREFLLEKYPDGKMELFEFTVERYQYATQERQPGELDWSVYEFNNPYEAQKVQFVISIPEMLSFNNLVIEINNSNTVEVPLSFQPGYKIKYTGKDHIYIYDSSWNLLQTMEVNSSLLLLEQGANTIKMTGTVVGKIPQPVKIEIKTKQRLDYF